MIPEFFDYLSKTELSHHTIHGYKIDLNQLSKWFEETNDKPLSPEFITPIDIRAYKKHLQKQKLKPGTINRKLINIRACLDWCVKQGYISKNPAQGIKTVTEIQRGPKWLTKQEIYAVLRCAEEQIILAEAKGNKSNLRIALRNRAMIGLMLHAGLRIGEVTNLAKNDIELNERSGKVIVRHGKGDKYREVPLNKDARDYLRAYTSATSQLFNYTSRNMEYHLNKLAKEAKIERKISPHCLRHTFGKSLVDAGVSLDRVAKLMGHSDIKTTLVYTQPSEADLQKAVDLIAWQD